MKVPEKAELFVLATVLLRSLAAVEGGFANECYPRSRPAFALSAPLRPGLDGIPEQRRRLCSGGVDGAARRRTRTRHQPVATGGALPALSPDLGKPRLPLRYRRYARRRQYQPGGQTSGAIRLASCSAAADS